MSYPIRLSDQLKQHLRALRKSRGLTQTQLGALVGVKQARIAEIEADPGTVSLDQLTKILAALGGALHLHTPEALGLMEPRIAASATPADSKAPAGPPKKVPAKKNFGLSPARSQGTAPHSVRRTASTAIESAPRSNVVIRAKKGAW